MKIDANNIEKEGVINANTEPNENQKTYNAQSISGNTVKGTVNANVGTAKRKKEL